MPITMSISRKTRRLFLDLGRPLGLVIALAVAGPVVAETRALAPLSLRCTLSAPVQLPAGGPVPLRFGIHNSGPVAVKVLRWNTPWEGQWAAPFVGISRNGIDLAYLGPMIKRGAPQAEDWFTLPAGGTITAVVDAAVVHDLSQAGSYEVVPRLWLLDVMSDGPSMRPAGEPAAPQQLDCPSIAINLVNPVSPAN
jgi:hypothetical protein